MATAAWRVFLAFILLGAAQHVRGKVVLVYSVQRHAARNLGLQTSDENRGPPITSAGQVQAWKAGARC
jgi:hypothetical protein